MRREAAAERLPVPQKTEKSPRERALRLLGRREYARAELDQRLRAWGVSPQVAAALLAEFEAAGYLSDARYAAATARHRAAGFAKRRILGELRARGVDAEVAQAALTETGTDDATTARALWQRRFGQAPADEKEKARQVRFLQARGFSPALIFQILREAGVKADDEG